DDKSQKEEKSTSGSTSDKETNGKQDDKSQKEEKSTNGSTESSNGSSSQE
ncbi:hypothetical protein IEU_05050, partial [Bacillus mycoides]